MSFTLQAVGNGFKAMPEESLQGSLDIRVEPCINGCNAPIHRDQHIDMVSEAPGDMRVLFAGICEACHTIMDYEGTVGVNGIVLARMTRATTQRIAELTQTMRTRNGRYHIR